MTGERVRPYLLVISLRPVVIIEGVPVVKEDVGELVSQGAALAHRVRRLGDSQEHPVSLGVAHGHAVLVLGGVHDCYVDASGLVDQRHQLAKRLLAEAVVPSESFCACAALVSAVTPGRTPIWTIRGSLPTTAFPDQPAVRLGLAGPCRGLRAEALIGRQPGRPLADEHARGRWHGSARCTSQEGHPELALRLADVGTGGGGNAMGRGRPAHPTQTGRPSRSSLPPTEPRALHSILASGYN